MLKIFFEKMLQKNLTFSSLPNISEKRWTYNYKKCIISIIMSKIRIMGRSVESLRREARGPVTWQ